MVATFLRRSLGLAVAAAIALSCGASAGAQSGITEVSLAILAPSAAEWPLFTADARGFFKDEGLHVTFVRGGSPPNVINTIASNGVNIAEDGTDSIIAAIGRGLPLKMIAPLFVVNPYSLVTVPSVKTWDDLKGKSVILGTKQDVTAIALENMAAAHHLSLNDFSIVVGGNTPARYAALQSGNVQGAMLAQPYDIIAASKGMNVLGSAYDTIKDWNFTAFIVNPSWANTNHATVVKFLRAMRKAIQYDYAHKAEAVADLVAVTHTDSETAGKAYDLDFTKWHAFDPNQRLSPSALENVGRYQVRFGAIKSVPAFSALADTTFIADVR